MIITIVGGIAFAYLIRMFDKGEIWSYILVEISFAITIFFYTTMIRVMLVTLDWSKWQLIVFKLHVMINCFVFFISGIFFIIMDFSFTNHTQIAFDNKVHDFMVLLIFTIFGGFY